MTRDKSINIVKEACVKANPEILELKFGCEIKSKHTTLRYVGKDKGQIALIVENGDAKNALMIVDKLGDVEILGRPIHLADVLLTMRDVDAEKIWGVDVSSGEFFGQSMSDGSPIYKKGAQWNLRKDSLINQSDETLSFLAQLLEKKD